MNTELYWEKKNNICRLHKREQINKRIIDKCIAILKYANGAYWFDITEENIHDIPMEALTEIEAMREVEDKILNYYLHQRNCYNAKSQDFRESMTKLRGESK